MRATYFQYITTEKHQKPKQPISKTEKIKSGLKVYFHLFITDLPPETLFTNFATEGTEKIYQNSENVERATEKIGVYRSIGVYRCIWSLFHNRFFTFFRLSKRKSVLAFRWSLQVKLVNFGRKLAIFININ